MTSGDVVHNLLKHLKLQFKYVSEFEKYVRMYPEQWFNYYPFWEEHA